MQIFGPPKIVSRKGSVDTHTETLLSLKSIVRINYSILFGHRQERAATGQLGLAP